MLEIENDNNNTVTEMKNAFVGFIEVNWSESYSVVSNSLQPHGLYRPWNSPGQNTAVTIPFSRGSFQPRDRTQVSHIAGGFFTSWATRVGLTSK